MASWGYPRRMPDPRPLPDDQLAAIAWADDTVSTVELATMLGLPRDRVWAARRRIKEAGHWSCPLIWSVCPVCGGGVDERTETPPPDHAPSVCKGVARRMAATPPGTLSGGAGAVARQTPGGVSGTAGRGARPPTRSSSIARMSQAVRWRLRLGGRNGRRGTAGRGCEREGSCCSDENRWHAGRETTRYAPACCRPSRAVAKDEACTTARPDRRRHGWVPSPIFPTTGFEHPSACPRPRSLAPPARSGKQRHALAACPTRR